MTDKDKKWIDGASYKQLLSHWRNAPIGNSMFSGDTGTYYGRVMAHKKIEIGHDAAVAASKSVGHEYRGNKI
jgi:hypothetical protein